MRSKTRNGILYFMVGTVISIITALTTGAASTSLECSCLIGLASLISLVVILIGLGMIIDGRNEFGKEHREFASYAAIAIVLGLGIFVLGTLMMITTAFPGASTYSNDQELAMDLSRLARGMIMGLIVAQLGSLMILIGEVLLVYKLENEAGREVLYLVLASGIIIAIVSIALYSSAINEFQAAMNEGPYSATGELVQFQNDINRIGLLSLITTILILIAYYIPFDRIENGELVPVLPNTPAFDPKTSSPQPDPPQYPRQSSPPRLAPVVRNVRIVTSSSPPPPPPPPLEEEKTQDYETKICPRCGIKCLIGYGPCPSCGNEEL